MESARTFVAFLACLALSVAASCALAPAEPQLDDSLDKSTHGNHFRVTLAPPEEGLAIHRLHAWRVTVRARNGELLREASVLLDGGMPTHGHGLPTRPSPAGEIAPGVHRIDGVKFHMAGWWELTVAVRANGVEDVATFNVKLDWPAAR
jgi:hypothetical protein